MRIQCISRPRVHLLLADDRDVVLRLAGDDAGTAADAGVQIDGHAPLVAVVGEFLFALRIEGQWHEPFVRLVFLRRFRCRQILGKARIPPELFQ